MQNTTCCLLTSQPFHTSQISVNQNKTAKLLNNDDNLTIIITFLKVYCKAQYFIFQVAVMNGDLIFITTVCDSYFNMSLI